MVDNTICLIQCCDPPCDIKKIKYKLEMFPSYTLDLNTYLKRCPNTNFIV